LEGLKALPHSANNTLLYGDLVGGWAPAYTWAGRYKEAEKRSRVALAIRIQVGEVDVCGYLRDLGLSLGLQSKYDEARSCFIKAIENHQALFGPVDRTSLCFWAVVLLKKGDRLGARERLERSWAYTREKNDLLGFPENLSWLGLLEECEHDWQRADHYYGQCLLYRSQERHYFESAALAGLIRVKRATRDYAALAGLVAETEVLVQQHEYNDHLASLRLTQGYVVWAGQVPEWGRGFEAAMGYFKHALIHALRFNRFLLDEVLWGGGVGTPLHPLIPHCLDQGEGGRQMLVALRDWWRTGINDVGVSQPATISPLQEGVPLVEAERLAREREPGDGTPQRSVIEQLTLALGS
jgi:tetratricopeptide (TPR) repeat protein